MVNTETKDEPHVVDPTPKRRRPLALAAGFVGCVVVVAVAVVLVRNGDNGASARSEERTEPALFVTVEPTTARAGEPVTITVRQEGGVGIVHLSTTDFGDGTVKHEGLALRGHSCGYSTPIEGRVRSFTHGYAVPGTYTLAAEASIYDPCDANAARTLTAPTTIEITAADQAPSNGPALPGAAVAAMPAQGQGPRTFTPIVSPSDEDGHVRSLTLEWGDGTPADLVEIPLDGCTIGPNGWPGIGDHARMDGAPLHTYAEAGTYTLTVTVTTTGCDGSSPQQATFASPPVVVR